MTKVIKGESEKLEDLNDKDVSLTCDTSLEDDDSEQRMSHEADDDMGYDPSDVAFTEWLRVDDEVELTDEEFSDNEDEVAEVFRIDTNIFDFETPIWKNDGYCNGGNLPGAYIVGDSLHCQDYEWYEALKDSELKEQALRNKAIMEGLISDDESSNDGWRRWESHEIIYHDHDELEYENETHDERQELC
ncbi:hypothetical protein Tco_1243538 [Tanacetum coccineum]